MGQRMPTLEEFYRITYNIPVEERWKGKGRAEGAREQSPTGRAAGPRSPSLPRWPRTFLRRPRG
eukprot:769340-Prorocentrum_lima.AAC.1